MLCHLIKEDWIVLELGCGTGYFTKELAETKAKIMAIDISPSLLKEAERTVKRANVKFILDNAYQMTFGDATFDAVIGSSVLHHLNVGKAIEEIFRVLKPGGIIAFTEPNMMNPQIALQKNIPYIKKKMGDSPDETAFFRWVIGKKLQQKGFEKVNVQPFDFLHPAVPEKIINTISRVGRLAEKTPLIREIAGSLYITAQKP